LEPDFEFVALRRASGRGEEETLDALDVLLRAGVIVEHDRQYAFAHPLVADVVRDDLSGARRVFLHRRAAEALEAVYAGRLPQVAGRLAAHYTQAALPTQAAHYTEMAAEHALRVSAPVEAVAFFRQALAIEPTPARKLGLGRALHRKGDLAEARSVLESTVQELEAQGDVRGAAQACIALCDAYLRAGRFAEVVAWAERGLAFLEREEDPGTKALAHHILGAAALHARRPLAEAERHMLEAARLADENQLPEIAARCRFGLGNVLAQRGDLAGALRRYQEAIPLCQAAGDSFHEILAHNNTAYHALLLGDLASAHAHIQTALRLADERALAVMDQWLYSTRGEIALAEKEWDAADDWFRRGLAEAEKQGNPEMIATYRANLGLAARGRGDYTGALNLLESARASAPASPLQAQVDLWLTELHLERGALDSADESLRRAEAYLAGEERERLRAWAGRLRKALGRVPGQ
jgi:tetratricopeptide (TPR) repeat protein